MEGKRKERDYENNVYKNITFPMKIWVDFETEPGGRKYILQIELVTY